MVNRKNQPQNPLSNFEFQDFLAAQGLLKRYDQDPNNWQIVLGRQKRYHSEKLWPILSQTPGYLVPGDEIATKLYGVSEPDDMNAASAVGRYLRSIIQRPESLWFGIVGQGVGVTDLKPSNPAVLETLYCLWEGGGRFVSDDLVAQRLYGGTSDKDIREARGRIRTVTNAVNFNNAEIQTASFANRSRYYRLKEIPDEILSRHSKPNDIYKKEFQDWLGRNKVIDWSEDIKTFKLKEGVRLSAREREICKLLRNHYGNIMPEEHIARFYYGNEPPDDWRKRLNANLHVLRSKLVDPKEIFTWHKEGIWGVGIDSLRLSKSLLQVLNSLWINMDEFVPLDEFNKSAGLEMRYGIDRLKKGLGKSDFMIGTRGMSTGVEYVLTHKDNLL